MSAGRLAPVGRAVLGGLFATGAFLLVSGVAYVLARQAWAWTAVAVGGGLVLASGLGLWRHRWIAPLQASLALLGGGCLVAGVLTDHLAYFLFGLGVLVVLAASLPVAHHLRRIADALESGRDS